MALIDDVKLALRITSNAFDDGEITPLIDACKTDLKMVGIDVDNHSEDALIKRAITLYVKANFGYREDSDKFEKAYESLKVAMVLSKDYEVVVEDGET